MMSHSGLSLRTLAACLAFMGFGGIVIADDDSLQTAAGRPTCNISDTAPVRIEMQYEEQAIRPGNTVRIDVTVTAKTELLDIEITAGVKGKVELLRPVDMRQAFLAGGDAITFTFSVKYTDTGLSTVRVAVQALEAGSHWSFGKDTKLNAFIRDDRAFAGVDAAHQTLRIRAVEADMAAKVITGREAREQIGRITRLEGVHDQTSNAPVPPAGQWAGESMVEPPATDEIPSATPGSPSLRGGMIRVMGNVSWLDENGTVHPSIGMNIEIRDDDTIGSELIMTLSPDINGNYDTGFFMHDDCFGCGDPDIFVRFRTENDPHRCGGRLRPVRHV